MNTAHIESNTHDTTLLAYVINDFGTKEYFCVEDDATVYLLN